MSRLFKGTTGLIFITLCVMYFLTYVDRTNIAVAGKLMSTELRLTKTQLGLALSAFGTTYLAMQVVNGFIGDRFGPRKVLFGLGALWSAGTILTGFATNLNTLICARMLVGLGEAGTIPTSTRAMTNWVPVSQRGLAQGFTHSAARLAAAATPPIVVAVLPASGWRGAFMILGALSLTWAVVWLFMFRDDPRKHPTITKAEIDDLPPYSTGVKVHQVPWGKLIPRIFPTVLVFFCHAWVLWLYLTWMPTFLQDHSHIDLKKAALFTGLIFLPGTLGDTVGGMLSDRLYKVTGNLNSARRNVVILGFGVSLVALSAVFFTTDINLVAIALSVALFFLEMTEGPVWAVPMDIAPRYAGVAGGFVSSAAGLGALVSPVAFGFIADKTGSIVVPFGVSMGLLALGIVLSFFMRADRPIEEGMSLAPSPSSAAMEGAL